MTTTYLLTSRSVLSVLALLAGALFLVQSAHAAPLSDGLVGYWNMDGDANDAVQSLDGTVNGDTAFVPNLGLAIGNSDSASFDGTGDFIEVADNAELDLTSAITAAGWIYIDSTAAQQGTVVSKWGDLGENERGYLLAVHTDETPRFYISTNGINFPAAIGSALTDGWHYLVGTYDGTTITLYVDGVLADTTVAGGSIRANNESLLIGANDGFGGALRKYTTGGVDEVRIYNRALTADEALDLYDYSFSVTLTQTTDVNPIGTDHTVTAELDSALAYIPVLFEVSGVNTASGLPYVYTNGDGKAEFTYTGGTTPGQDTIVACVDVSWFVTGGGVCDAPFDEPSDNVVKTWFVSEFVTGGGVIKGANGKKNLWSFGGTVGRTDQGDVVGNIQIQDVVNKRACHLNEFTSLVFSGGPAETPTSEHDTASFVGAGTCNDGTILEGVEIIMIDNAEPGAGADTVEINDAGGLGDTAAMTLSGGNFQVHPPEEI